MSNHVGPVLRVTLQSALLFRTQPLLGNRVLDAVDPTLRLRSVKSGMLNLTSRVSAKFLSRVRLKRRRIC